MEGPRPDRRTKKVAVFVPNNSRKFKYFIRDDKIGEGTYAVVYRGWAVPSKESFDLEGWKSFVQRKIESGEWNTFSLDDCSVLEKESKFPFRKYEKVAIKKIKVSSYRSGVSMSAIREIKFLQELNHPNVIQVCEWLALKP